jgi:UDP-N-acetylmuramoyl-tripeptide--D-alanyl-D-alanine ligase
MALSKVWQGRVMRVALSNDNLSENTPCPDLIAELNAEATKMQLKHQSITLDLPLSGNHNARNLLLALAVANELSIDFNSLTNLDVILPEGRAKTIKLEGRLSGVTVHDETYNASPEAVLASLDLLSQQPGRRFALLGTMLELGDQSEFLHKQIGMKAAALGIDGLIVLADALESKALMEGAKDIKLIYSVNSVDEAAKKLHSLLKSGDYLLLKASRAVALEKIIPLLQD